MRRRSCVVHVDAPPRPKAALRAGVEEESDSGVLFATTRPRRRWRRPRADRRSAAWAGWPRRISVGTTVVSGITGPAPAAPVAGRRPTPPTTRAAGRGD